jgi:hypothetical protein
MKTTLFLFASVLSISLFTVSCKKDNRSVPIQLLLTDNPAAYDSVNVHIEGIRVKIDKDDSGWIDIKSKDTTINLLDLKNGATMLLAQDNIPAGTLKEVRFILGSDSYVVIGGERHDLQTPSAEDAGLKIKIDKKLNETLNSFTLDFDADLSIKEDNGNYKLMPVIKLK